MANASLGSAVKLASDKVRERFGAAMPRPKSATRHSRNRGERGPQTLCFLPSGRKPEFLDKLRKGQVPFASQARGDESKCGNPLMFAFGADIVEVRTHRLAREIRVPRVTRAFAAGRSINPWLARSHYMGAMIWGMASTLLGATEIDEKRGL